MKRKGEEIKKSHNSEENRRDGKEKERERDGGSIIASAVKIYGAGLQYLTNSGNPQPSENRKKNLFN